MAVKKLGQSYPTLYFDQCGSVNLTNVLRTVRKVLRRRPALCSHKIVIFTAQGEGPILATTLLKLYKPKIIAVTFPPTFRIIRGEESIRVQIPQSVSTYLKALDVDIISTRLPFDLIEGASTHNTQLDIIAKSLSLICTSFPLCVQAVLQACDAGLLDEGEDVIAITGDCAALISASYTKSFLTPQSPFQVREIFCKPSVKEAPVSRGDVRRQLIQQDQSSLPLTIDGAPEPDPT